VNPVLPALALVACFAVGLRGIALIRDRGPAKRLEAAAVRTPAERRPGGPLLALLDVLAVRLERPMAGLLGEQRLARVSHLLDAAGRPLGMTARSFAGRKAALILVLGVAGALLSLQASNPLWVGLYLVAGWLVPDAWLSGRARRRQARIDRDLPDFLDVLAVSVTAGVGFRPALRRVAEGVGGPVAEEVLTALHQIDLGQPRREAFEAMRRRNDSEFLAQFVTSLLQAEELGVPLADALQDLAREMRRSAHQRARRRAQRAGPRVSLITTALIVPGAMILILAALFAGIGTDISDTLGR
jgi:tight adherence protein C